MKNKHLLLAWKEVSTARRNNSKNCEDLGFFFSFFYFCKFCINEFRSVSHEDIAIVNKFYIMSLQDIIRLHVFRKNKQKLMKDPEVGTLLFDPTTENIDDTYNS